MTAATAATATVRRDWNGVVCFSCGKFGSCSNTVPELGRVVSVYAARMAGRENSGGIYYDPTTGGDGPKAGGKR